MLRNAGAVVYGTIAVGALLAAESPTRETYAATVGAVAIALLVYSLAHSYSELAEHRLEHRQPLTLAGLGQALVSGLMVDVGAVLPLLTLAICWVAGVRLTSAVTAAVWTAATTILLAEVVAGVRAGLATRALVAQSVAGALFGLLVIALKVILH